MNRLQRACVTLAFLSALIVAGHSSCGAAIQATLLMPTPGKQVSGPKVEVAVGYNTGSLGSVTRMELSVDGAQYGSKVMDVPKKRGVASFLWDSRLVPNGKHKFQVTIYAGDKILGAVSGSLTSSNEASSSNIPLVKFQNLKNGSVISGSADIKINISGLDSDSTVAVLIDKIINGIKNTPPYDFTVNTTDISEGRHVLDAYALDGAGNRVEAQQLEVMIQNKPSVSVATTVAPKTPDKTQVTVTIKPAPKKITPPSLKTPSTVTTSVAVSKPTVPRPIIKPEARVASAKSGGTTSAAKTTKAPAKIVMPPARTKSAASSIAKAKTGSHSPMVSVQTPSVPASTVEPVSAKLAQATEKPIKTGVSIPEVKHEATAQTSTKVSISTPKPGSVGQPVKIAKATTEPVAKTPAPVVKTNAKRTILIRPSVPMVNMAWAQPSPQEATLQPNTPLAFATPKLEPQDILPSVKVTPATPRVAQTVNSNRPSTLPTVLKPTVTPTTPTPEPVMAKAARLPVKVAETKEVAPVAVKKPAPPNVKPEVVARAVEPSPASTSQQTTQKMMDVSLRWALQMAGLNVSFADDGRVIKGSDGAKTIEFQVGAREVLVGDHVVVLPSPVTSVGGRAMIPLSFIVEQLGLALKDPSLIKPQAKAN